MRINEYNNLDEFISEYIGVWNPSDGHWFGLDFSYNGETYRLHTGSMYSEETNELPDGRETMFGLYLHKQKPAGNKYEYAILGKFAVMNYRRYSTCICGRRFKDVIMDDSTEILGKD